MNKCLPDQSGRSLGVQPGILVPAAIKIVRVSISVVWTNDADGNTNYFNRRWYEYTGLNSKRPAALIWQALIHPDDAPISKKRWQRALKTGEAFECEDRAGNPARGLHRL